MLHGQDDDGLVSRLDPDGRPSGLAFIGSGCADRVPFFHKLAACHTGNGDVDETDIVIFVLFLFLLNILVDMDSDAEYGWKS